MRIIKHIFRPDPEILYIEPYFGCNYKCFFCIHGGKTAIQPAQLQPETFQKLKPVIDTIGHVHITGLGEPFLNPHLTDYLLYFRERGKKYYLNTNGSLIQDGHVDVMTTSMCELSISLDAADKETYANVRHPEYWDIIISRLKQIAEIKARRKSPFPLIYLTLHLNSRNLASLPRLPDLCK